ncbi:SAM-dependent methyltransferase [Candidatus Methylospira mobilis]|uniref:SAM-dependent methyltransferase n=1 Tax=Candidatus Methylospira mobilis TaxID=1808979 RepID=A0A5Q0BD30_9GAMM|nr:class I SAM-dependent methyltransferase [Candidatus Methylospira mobilis]QFY41710.1 SAM-dependent methyltransferase [Candidatus Methylospira mobilis]
MSNKNLGLSDTLYDYLLSVSSRESAVQRRLREETAQLPLAGMQITPEQGQFMALLAKLIQAKRVLEIGVFTGYSSLAVALALPEDGRITACDVSEEWTGVARRYWELAGVSGKISLQLGPALTTLDELIADGHSGLYDMAFIDADKENYDGYYERTLQLLRTGGLLLLDNLLWGGKVADPGATDKDTLAIRALNEKIHHDARVINSLLPVADGLGLVIKQ